MHKHSRREVLQYLASVGASCAAALPACEAAVAAPASVASMRITKGEAIQVRVPWAERVRESSVTNWRRENMIVPNSSYTLIRLYTDEGHVGVGIGGSQGQLNRMVGHSPWEYVMDDSIGGILMAVYDVLGQATGLPICRLFSPNPRNRIIQTWWSLSYPPDMIAAEAKMAAGLGYRVHKVKARPWEDPVAQAAAICAAVPKEYRVWADANFFWGSVGRTLRFANELAKLPNYFGLESPINRGYLEGYRQLKGKTPLQMSEHVGIIDTMTAIREGLLEAFIVAGTFGRYKFRLNAWASFYGKQLWDESSCWTGIGQVFQAHQAAAYPSVTYTIGCAQIAEDDLVVEPFTMDDGYYAVPQKPGMGVTVDEKALDKYRVS